MHGHFDLKKSHFDSRNWVADEIQPSFAGVYCVVSGLCGKLHWQDFPSNWSIIKALVKCKPNQSYLRTFSASRGPHLILGELLFVTEQATLFEDLVKEHVDHMEQPKLLKNLFTESKTTSSLAIKEMWLGPVELMVARTTRPEQTMRWYVLYHWKVQQKRM